MREEKNENLGSVKTRLHGHDNLRSHPIGRAHKSVGWVCKRSRAKVAKLHLSFSCDQDIGGLDVSGTEKGGKKRKRGRNMDQREEMEDQGFVEARRKRGDEERRRREKKKKGKRRNRWIMLLLWR